MADTKVIDILTEFSLTRQEASIYAALLNHGDMTGYEVAKDTGFSRSNVYAALNALVEKGQSSKRYKLGEFWELNLSEIKEALDDIPSAEPERHRGEWVEDGHERGFSECSKCGYIAVSLLSERHYNFCPSCGADMRGENGKA